jgi:hypothetical protein
MFGEDSKKELASKWTRCKEGEPVEGVFVGKERMGWVKYTQTRGSIECSEHDQEAKRRFCSNFYRTDQGSMTVFDGPKGLGRAIFARGPKETDVCRVSREGSGRQTRYTVEKIRTVTPDELREISEAELFYLGEVWQGFNREEIPTKPIEDSDIPF